MSEELNKNKDRGEELKTKQQETFAQKLYRLAFFILIPLAIGFIGSIFTSMGMSGWYTTLDKPPFNPPGWVFAPVWTALYTLMGIALYLVWRQGFHKRSVKIAVGVFSFQLLLNLAWSFIFFTMQQPTYALIEIIILWSAIIATIYAFKKVSPIAAYTLIPYILWVTLAIVLNASIVVLNM